MANVQIGNYSLVKKIATGGMAEVWLARQQGIEGFNRHIVVKRILPHLSEDPEFVQMFLNEAKIAARFNHPNIAQIYDLGNADGQYFIAMEFIHGEDLGRLMRKAWSTGQWIARPLAIRIIAEACKGLFYAHNRADENGTPLRVVHRDISPQNILISFDGSVKLVDFGIAKAADQASMTKSGAIKGKFAYMAPEQAGGKPLDARTDIFALGLVLYELLTGVRPLKRDSELATLQAALECAIDAPSIVAEVPSELDEVVMRALAKAPDDRYRDASSFQMALEEFLIGQRLVATSVQISELMETLFAERRAEEQKLGAPNPPTHGDSQQALPAMPEAPRIERATPSKRFDRQQPEESTEDGEDEGTGTESARPGEGGGDDDPPPSQEQVMPSRRYSSGPSSMGPQTALERAHSPNAPELTRQKPQTREVRDLASSEVPPSRRRSRMSLQPMNGNDGPNATHDEPPETIPPPPAARRSSSSNGKIRRVGDMPEAPPPRKSSAGMPPVRERVDLGDDRAERVTAHEKAPRGEKSNKLKRPKTKASSKENELDSASYDLEDIRRKQGQRRTLALIGLIAVSAIVLFVIFRYTVRGAASQDEGVPIILSVTSNPRTHVIVKHGGGLASQPTDLGETPIEDVKGAFVGDTIVLYNEEICLTYEESIQFGEPMEHRRIEKNFSEGQLVVSKHQ